MPVKTNILLVKPKCSCTINSVFHRYSIYKGTQSVTQCVAILKYRNFGNAAWLEESWHSYQGNQNFPQPAILVFDKGEIQKKKKSEIFCFAYLRWCHIGWASNILIGRCTGCWHHQDIGCPSMMTLSKIGKTKKSLMFSFVFQNCAIFAQYQCDLFINFKFHIFWHELNNYIPLENKCFNPNNHHCSVFTMLLICIQARHVKCGYMPITQHQQYPTPLVFVKDSILRDRPTNEREARA